ncbi:cyanophycin synthetase [Sphaerotilus hippei]|uniref:Cyanophycin synthetase n=1 Tax=Sphaerotilus hippei TaxID=744406 RepID=A0A318HHK8_9BURK|nr:cyanophycin synthetase [Sphaerotilus hippei]PXW99553.1 cyanophycin synthetase [Sphaerotilus hippei]
MNKNLELTLLRSSYLRGPNIWTYRPVLETWLDLGELEEWPSDRLPGFNARLLALLPALTEHHCGVGERGGFLQRLESGTWAGHILEHIVIELLNLSGMPTGFGQTRSTSRHGVYRMVFRARDEQVALCALQAGHALLTAALHEQPFDVAAAVAQIREKLDDCYLGPSTASIVGAATDRRIPHIRLNDGNLVQLGYGARQRRIWTAETEMTSAIGEGIAGDKDLTKSLLKACGVPVPEGSVADTPAAAWDAAEDIGLPVVVKPTDGNHGRGVSLDLNTREEVEAAWAVADQEGSEVIVERYIRGDEHRVLVVGGQVAAAARGESLWITGNGHSTVAQLIDSQLNSDPRRGDAEEFPLETIRLENEPVIRLLLERQGLAGEAVPAAGRHVLIQRNGNVAIDCTDAVHPEVAHQVCLAARVIGLDIAGVDLVTTDIGLPLHETGGAIVEVNAGPGLLMHLKPAQGSPRPVGRAIVDHLFPDEDSAAPGRIPIVGIAGSRDTQVIARLVAWLVHLSGRQVGLACREGLYLGRRRVEAGHQAHWEAGTRLLMNRNVELAVFESNPVAILDDGLPYDRCQVGVITDLDLPDADAAALAEHDVQHGDQLVKVLRTQVDVVLAEGAGVLNAADARLADLADLCDGEVIFYAADGALEVISAHRAQDGRAVFLKNGQIVLARGPQETPCLTLQRLPRAGQISIDSLLAVAATAWALGISPDLISAGIETFERDTAPA